MGRKVLCLLRIPSKKASKNITALLNVAQLFARFGDSSQKITRNLEDAPNTNT